MTTVDRRLGVGISLHGHRLPLRQVLPGRLIKKALSRAPSPRFIVPKPDKVVRLLHQRLSPVRISLEIGSPSEPLQWCLQPRLKTLKPLLKQAGRTLTVVSPDSKKMKEFLMPLSVASKGSSGELKGHKWKAVDRRSHSSTGMVSAEINPEVSAVELQWRNPKKGGTIHDIHFEFQTTN